jgi:hypothetical protein
MAQAPAGKVAEHEPVHVKALKGILDKAAMGLPSSGAQLRPSS